MKKIYNRVIFNQSNHKESEYQRYRVGSNEADELAHRLSVISIEEKKREVKEEDYQYEETGLFNSYLDIQNAYNTIEDN